MPPRRWTKTCGHPIQDSRHLDLQWPSESLSWNRGLFRALAEYDLGKWKLRRNMTPGGSAPYQAVRYKSNHSSCSYVISVRRIGIIRREKGTVFHKNGMSSLGYEYVHLHAIPNPAGWFEHIVTASRLRCWKLIWPHRFFHIRTNLEYTTDGTPPVKNVTKVYPILTLVYWNVSCLPVNVASMECGEVSIWQIPGAAHRFKHGCASLISW